MHSKPTPPSSIHFDHFQHINSHCDTDHCEYHSHCDTPISHCNTPMVSIPQNIASMWTFVSPPGFENYFSSALVPGLLPPPSFRITHPLCSQILPPIASQPDHSNPPPLATTNPTLDKPSSNHLKSLRILQWNSGGLSSSRRAALCSFLSTNRYDLVLLQETNLSGSRNFKVPGYSVFRADRTLTRRGPATARNQNGAGVFTRISSDLSFQMVHLLTLSDPASDYLCVNFQKRYPLLLMFTPHPSETLNSTLDLAPSPLNFSRTPLTPLFSVISMLITPPGTPTSLPTVLVTLYSIRISSS